MKTVIVSVVGLLLAISAHAQNTCSKVPAYEENIVPNCTPDFYNKGIKLPNYANVQTYYTCPTSTSKTGQIQNCPSGSPYFSLTYQSCNTCADYLPAVKCSGLNLGLECVPMNSTGSSTVAPPADGPSTAAPSTAAPSTAAPSTAAPSTAAPSTSSNAPSNTPSTAMPGPPVDSDTTTASSGGDLPSSTIFVPQPPSPNEGPTPPGPDPTVPNLPAGPPQMENE